MAYEACVHNPGCLVVVLVLASAFLHVKISVTLFRVYVGMSLGNVHSLYRRGLPLYWWCQCGILDHYGMWPDVSCHAILMNV